MAFIYVIGEDQLNGPSVSKANEYIICRTHGRGRSNAPRPSALGRARVHGKNDLSEPPSPPMPVFFSPLGLTTGMDTQSRLAHPHRCDEPISTCARSQAPTRPSPSHLSRAASASLSAALNPPAPSSSSPDPASPAPAHAECHEQGVLSLMQARNIPLEHVCLLDLKAPTALTPADGDGDAASKFAWFLFGVRILRFPFLLKPFRPLTTPLYSFGRAGWLFFLFFFLISVRVSSVRRVKQKKKKNTKVFWGLMFFDGLFPM